MSIENLGKPGSTKKPPKPASIYRKPIAEKVFRKRYLARIEQVKDRTLLESSFELVEGSYTLKADLDRETLIHLNKLAKAVKGNRGFVKTGPAVLALLFVSAVVVFILFFMNPVLERSMERGLETAFGARADVKSFRFSPFRLGISMASVTVADRNEPMKNLFETGRIELRMNFGALIRGRVHIEEASAASIALGTPRKVSGALIRVKAAPKAAAVSAAPAPSPIDAISSLVDFENFDAMALLEREKDRLRTTAAYNTAAAAYEAAAARWKDRVETSKSSVAGLAALSKTVLSINPKTFRTLDDVNKAIEEVKVVAESAKVVAEEAKSIVAGVKSDVDVANDLVKNARTAVEQDLAYLKSFVDPKSGAARNLLEPVIWQILSDKVERYLYYGRRGLEVAGKLKANSAEKTEEKRRFAAARRGRDVVFPSAAIPRFRLELLASSFTAGKQTWQVELREVSSDPDLVPAPTTLLVAMERGDVQGRADVVADFRSVSAEAFSVDVKGTRLPMDLGNSLSKIGLGGFTGRLDAELILRGEKVGDVEAAAKIDVKEAAASSPKGMFGRVITEALASVDAVKLDVAYEKPKGEDIDVSVDTNLDELIAKVITDLAVRYAKQAIAELEKALRDYVGAELEGKLSKEQLDALFALAKGDEAVAASLRKTVEDKKAELEGRAQAIMDEARRLAEEALERAKEEARRAAAKVQAEAEAAAAKAQAEAAAAKAQAEAEAKKAADAAKAEAQQATDAAAKKASDALKKVEKPKIKF